MTKTWAEGAPEGEVIMPGEELRRIGYRRGEIARHQHHNWLFQKMMRSAISRFATAEDFIASEDDLGIVLPKDGNGAAPIWSEDWKAAGASDWFDLCADGEFLWVVTSSFPSELRKVSRVDGSVLASTNSARLDYHKVACAGGNVYALKYSVGGKPVIRAFSRDDLTLKYSETLPDAVSAVAICTDGTFVAVAAGEKVYLYQDTGSALVYACTADHGAALHCLAMDGELIAVGGEDGYGGAGEIEFFDYGCNSVGLISRSTNSAKVTRLALGNGAIAFIGDADENGNKVGLFRSVGSALLRRASILTWESGYDHGDLVIDEDGCVVATDMYAHAVVKYAPDGVPFYAAGGVPDPRIMKVPQTDRVLPWGDGVPVYLKLAYDFDGLFVLGTDDGDGKRIKRIALRNQPRMYSGGGGVGAIHSLIRPAPLGSQCPA